ncbi:SDR family oxidoreductase [Bradyrhizobium ivorense]|uniref:SDR family oxidoreductase n=1 Tax=Bradyrhizobium ivorense TaxID=2511166 RepID=UPI0010B7713E|nr:SDR family oxidoreductase [Bradyrhizobium ivorense]MCC8935763.1 SDR family oxidoreductase [Bradyrhizobium ivorense]VIO77629.1 Diacetyl reductase [(S)-acetoin forming] [Bradyrhizobium ivorense]
MDKKLKNNIAVVTGAAKGIGLAIAERLARDGAKLVLADLDEPGLQQASTDLASRFDTEVVTQAGDLSDQNVAEKTIRLASERFGRLDILVNNAGGGIIRPFAEHTPETLKTTIDRNLWTVLWCSWYAVTPMRKQGYGRIVNLGADSVRNGLWDHAAYNAAKGGMHGLTTGMAREFARDGITVNTVAPCAVNTPQMVAITKSDPALAAKFVSVIPMGRPAEMEEVASMVSYLASAEASFVTGQVISVNGGSTML